MVDALFWLVVVVLLMPGIVVIGLRSFDVGWPRVALVVAVTCGVLGAGVVCVLWSVSLVIWTADAGVTTYRR